MHSWRLSMTAFIVAMALMSVLLGYAGERKACPAADAAGLSRHTKESGNGKGRREGPCPLQLEVITLRQGTSSGMVGLSSLPVRTSGS